MSKRLYVAVRYDVSYDSSAGFNYHNVEFKEFLNSLNVSTYDIGGEFTDGYGDEWECIASEFSKALTFLKKHKDAIYNYENDKGYKVNGDEICLEYVYDGIMGLECGETFEEAYKEVVSMMEAWKKQSAKPSGYMHFCAF